VSQKSRADKEDIRANSRFGLVNRLAVVICKAQTHDEKPRAAPVA
jgi:hypothetical protein